MMPETNAGDNDMKRFTQLLLASVAVSLISWYTDEKPKPIPPDNAADVRVLTSVLPQGDVILGADHNVVQMELNGADIRKDPRVAPALGRLRHVRIYGTLGNTQEADEVLRDPRLAAS